MMRILMATGALAVALVGSAPRPQQGRPVILLLHGRGLVTRDTASLRKFWYESLRNGARVSKRDSLLSPDDVRLVWYADVLDPISGEACTYSGDDPRARRDAAIDPGFKSFVSLVGNFFGALTNVVDDSGAVGELRTLASDASFLSDSHKRCAAERRLGDAIDRAKRDGRPVILVAHSLGSVVAYDYLSTRRDSGVVQRFVTLGAMVGSADLRRLLIGGDSTDNFALPRSVASWVNVRNRDDILAIPIPFGRDVETDAPADEPDHHDMVSYLRNGITADAILDGWCGAFVSSRPAGCVINSK